MAVLAERKKVDVTFGQAIRIVAPYTWHQLFEQIIVVIPVVLYLAIFQWIILQWNIEHIGRVSVGISMVILGLMFFMEGVKIGILPMGETVGRILPQKAGMAGVLIFAFILGLLAAYGEPVIGSLQIAGSGVDQDKAPLLYTLLLGKPFIIVAGISIGVGIAFVISILRYIRDWSIKPIALTIVGLSAGLTLYASHDPDMASAIGLAWDAGAVIAGPVSTPLLLALGMGICMVLGKSDTGMAGLGSVGMMSLFPIVIILGIIFVLRQTDYGAETVSAARIHGEQAPDFIRVAWASLFNGARAIVPVFLFLLLTLRLWLKETEECIPLSQFFIAGGFAIFGLFLFNFGLTFGLGELGNQVGHRLPYSFHPPDESIYPTALGKIIVVAFGGILGYGATLAEPAFNTLGQQVEEITQGAFKKWLFSQAVAVGVGVGASMGMASLIYGLDLLKLLLPPYLILLVLTILAKEKYASIAWDGGAVTTGPVTVPLKISIGIALSHATGFAEGFGILALASAYPVMNILFLGLYVSYHQKR
jgi:hypothetical protein